ncbi:hypothetical protein, partial [Thalassospira povalilytica]|uniref:hypothetical protein n=1 Tax=Thalassospira povalilytica TaxID=732237 RepID=UPI003AA97B41
YRPCWRSQVGIRRLGNSIAKGRFAKIAGHDMTRAAPNGFGAARLILMLRFFRSRSDRQDNAQQ